MDYVELDAIDLSNFQYPDPIEREPLDEDELELLYDAFKRPRDRLMATVAAETGARNSDIVRISLPNLDLSGNEPQIEMTNTKSGGTYTVYISGILATEIRHFIGYQRQAYTDHEDSDYLFLSGRGGRLCVSTFSMIVRKAAKRAGIQSVLGTRTDVNGNKYNLHRVTPHALRHTFNNLMEKEEIPSEQRARAMGQKSVDVNQKYYSHDDSGYKKLIKRLHNR